MTKKEVLRDAISRGLRYSRLLREVYKEELNSVPSNLLLAEIISKDLQLITPLTATQIAEVKRIGKLKHGKKGQTHSPPFTLSESEKDSEQAKNLANQIKENGNNGKMW